MTEAPRQRLVSLDVARGLTVALMIVVNSAAYVQALNGFEAFPWLLHSPWAGFTAADAVFPAFIFLVGVSIAVASGGKAPGAGHIAARTMRLLLIGLLLSNMYWLADFAANAPRLMGVLQRIGLVYLAGAILYPLTGWKARLAITAGLLALYWPLCLLASPDGTATDLATPGLNFVHAIDRLVLGPLNFVKGPTGYDPEGLLSTLPAIAQGLLGTLAGDWLVRRKGARGLAIAGVVLITAGLACGLVFPPVKDLWSSSYVLLSSGVTLVVVAALHATLDRPGARLGMATVFLAFGVNAIAAYVLHELASLVLVGDVFKLPYELARPCVGEHLAALLPVLLFTGLIWIVMDYMRRRGWFIRI